MARGRNWSGLAMAVASGAAFGTSGVLARSLLDGGWSAAAAVTIRVAVAAVALTVPALLQLRGRWPLLVRTLPAVLAFGLVAVAGCQLAYFLAVSRLSVGVALLLEYSGVVLVVLWTWLRSGRRRSTTTLAGVAVAVVGLALVLDVLGDVRIDPIGVLWGLVAAVGLAVYFVVSARTDDALPPLVTSWAGMAVGAVVLCLAGAVGAVPWVVRDAPVVLAGVEMSWLVPVLGLGLVAAALAYVLGVAAVQRLGARLASFVGLTEVLFAVLFAWLALGQQPGPLQLIGGAVVLTGIVLVRLGERSPASTVEAPDLVPARTGG